eukprot:GFUD01110896.1.p1 GENE.GFUD01110896.1~~GFUD01110896.1.p1  ORF type:complete len:372 (-),score=143.23 GFUD01110896.1:60-1175(-)
MPKFRPLLLLFPCLQAKMTSKKSKMSRKSSSFQEWRTLAEFGYGFNTAGQMRRMDSDGQLTEELFQFEVKAGDKAYNQAHYEALGEVITEEVYGLLEKQGKLNRVDIGPADPKSFIFCSRDYQSSEKLLVLIHGSGVVRAGQWARRLIINEDLNKGTMLPFIEHAREKGWGVVVMNTNMNTDTETGMDIPGSDTPEEHADTVWQSVVAKSEAKNIVIIAHSFGGVVAMNLARSFKSDFLSKVSGVFLTDSVHYKLSGDKKVDRKLEKIGKNYVGSDLELGVPVKNLFGGTGGIPRFSAGHEQHEWTSWSAMEEIFKDMEKAGKDTLEKEHSGASSSQAVNEEKDVKLTGKDPVENTIRDEASHSEPKNQEL